MELQTQSQIEFLKAKRVAVGLDLAYQANIVFNRIDEASNPDVVWRLVDEFQMLVNAAGTLIGPHSSVTYDDFPQFQVH